VFGGSRVTYNHPDPVAQIRRPSVLLNNRIVEESKDQAFAQKKDNKINTLSTLMQDQYSFMDTFQGPDRF
jgi:hypothetical protein